MKLENDLWSFALNFYQQPGVEALCLKLQSAYSLSINRLLLACWAGSVGKEIEPEMLTTADAWQLQITQQLRQLRYQVRQRKDDAGFAPCYQALRQAELACEQVELAMLYEAVEAARPASSGSLLVAKNLKTYLKSAKLPIDTEIGSELSKLQQALTTYLRTNVSE